MDIKSFLCKNFKNLLCIFLNFLYNLVYFFNVVININRI